MTTLGSKHPAIYKEFLDGNFTVKKTKRAFSYIATDQPHEQNNACVKGYRGAVGLTQNPTALQRWMVSGPEMARLIEEFQTSIEKDELESDRRHHEQTGSTQKTFFNQVNALSSVIEEMGNPFTEESGDLLVLDTRELSDPAVHSTMRTLEKKGQEQYDAFVKERLVTYEKT